MKIVVLGGATIVPEDLVKLRQMGEVYCYETPPRDEAEVIAQLSGAQVAVVHLTPITERVMAALPALKLICLAVAGVDAIDICAATARGITVCYAPGYATEAVAEHTIMLMLAAARSLGNLIGAVRSGIASARPPIGVELQGKTIGVIGCGRIGGRVAEIARNGLCMNVCSYDQHSSPADLDALLSVADIISLHLPLTESTRNFVDAAMLARMRWGVTIVNTARGGLIDEQALIEKLNSGHVAAAALDVLVHEPASPQDPLVMHERVIVTPHCAFRTHEALQACSHIVRANIEAFLAQKPINVVC